MTTDRFLSSFDRLIAIWILRAFSAGLGRHGFMDYTGYADAGIAEFLGMPSYAGEHTRVRLGRYLDGIQNSVEQAGTASLPARAQANFNRFANELKLNPVEQRIVEFFACMETESVLEDTVRVNPKIFERDTARFLGIVLDLPRNAVSTALSPMGNPRLLRTRHLRHGAAVGVFRGAG